MTIQGDWLEAEQSRARRTASWVEADPPEISCLSRLVASFPVLVASEAGARSLRQLVVELAVRGRLTRQDTRPVDRPRLFQAIEAGYTKAAEQSGIRANRTTAEPKHLWELPSTWTWTTLGRVFPISSGTTPSRTRSDYFGGAVAWVKTTDLNNGVVLECEERLTAEAIEACGLRIYPKDTVCIAMYGGAGTIGKSGVLGMESTINQSVCALVPNREAMLPDFLHAYLKAIRTTWMDHAAGLRVAANINAGAIRDMSLPLPPLAEQKRIVARVDQLMALIDDLEAKQAKKREVSIRFTKASLEALTTAEGPEEFDAAWQRVAENFGTVLDAADKVGALRQSLLRLAVRGQLVAPQGKRSAVDALLRRTEAKRAVLVAARKASRRDELPPVTLGEQPFSIPTHWIWTRLGIASICRDGQRIPVSKEERATRRGGYDYYGASGVIDKVDDYIFDETLLLIGEDGANLLSRSTPIAFLAFGKYWVNNHAHVLDSADVATLRYLTLYVNATDLAPYVTGTAQPKMNQAKMNMIPVALPPPEEQAMIVVKVEHLMKLCDDLESQLRRSEDRASKLVEAVVQELVA